MDLYNETEIENWLATEARDLPMPDGSTRPTRAFRLVWETMDSLILTSGYSRLELTKFAAEESRLQGIPFETAFTGVVSWLDDQRRGA